MKRDRPKLKAALDYPRPGETLAVWKLDRFACSVRRLVETAEDLAEREIGLRVVTQAIDTTSPAVGLCLTYLRPWRSLSAS